MAMRRKKINVLLNYIFRKRNDKGGIWNRIFLFFEKRFGDSTVIGTINGYKAKMPFSYMGIFYQKSFPLYDKQLGKICAYAKKKLNRDLKIIDVGANIGDTVLCIGDKDNEYLLVEGEESYSSYIDENLHEFNYILCEKFCADTYSNDCGKICIKKNGTAHLANSNAGNNIKFDTIDNMVFDNHFEPDIFKIDTDGYDFKVLRGGSKIIQVYKPILFFEWDLNMLLSAGEDPMSIFCMLKENGYNDLILFDNFGNLLCSIDINNEKLLRQLLDYTSNKHIYYYDVCAIHNQSTIKVNDIYKYLEST